MPKIMVQIPLTKYLRELTRDWGQVFITKSLGGQVWISNEAPGECFEDNEIEFNDSDVYIRLPKELHQHIDLELGNNKSLKQVLGEIRQKELQA